MSDIVEVKKQVTEFLREALKVDDIKVVKVVKNEDGWDSEAEVYEESSLIKSLGLPTKVRDRNLYLVKLDNTFEVRSYERKEKLGLTE